MFKGIAIVCKLDYYLISGNSLAMVFYRNKNITLDSAIIRYYKSKIFLALVSTYDFVHAPYKNVPDTTFLSLTA